MVQIWNIPNIWKNMKKICFIKSIFRLIAFIRFATNFKWDSMQSPLYKVLLPQKPSKSSKKRHIKNKAFFVQTNNWWSWHEKYTLSHHRITIKIFAFHLEIWFFFLGMTTTSLVPKINFEAVMAAIQRHLECKYHNKEDYHCTG